MKKKDWHSCLILIMLWGILGLLLLRGGYVQQKAEKAENAAAAMSDHMRASSGDAKKTVVLDAGHGGKDAGAVPEGGNITEASVNLSILKYVVAYMEKEEDVRVICTRTQDEELSRDARVQLANQSQADLFVSIHCNSGKGGNGTEVMYMPLTDEKKRQNTGFTSQQLASVLSDSVSDELGFKNRGLVKGEQIEIIRKAEMPAALVEVGFLNSAPDQDILLSEEGQKKAAKGIYKGIRKALEELEDE